MADLTLDEGELNQQVMGAVTSFTAGFVRDVTTMARTRTVPVRTGYLRSTIVPGGVRRVGPWTVESSVLARADYAAPVHEGSQPHVIRPRRAKALRFTVGNRVVFARSVNHPGSRPRPFLTEAVRLVATADPRITF